jgi:hypothetical protein
VITCDFWPARHGQDVPVAGDDRELLLGDAATLRTHG